ncbi:excalibur calcium-binding domain-containing protein [Alteromonadaceae bacterium M269]|nr:excalibur calcium-binding domain-containing protein [Alteromonadaceae bacterium M269]
MKNWLILILVVLVAWKLYTQNQATTPQAIAPTQPIVFEPVEKEFKPTITYHCDGRQNCSQMRSYDEALYFLKNCPDTKMDGDNDGIPCERQFGR